MILAHPSKSNRALTLLEMMVSVALLSFIILGLTAMFVQTQKAFKSGIKQTDTTDAGRTVIEMVARDFSQLADPHFTNYYFNDYSGTFITNLSPTLFWRIVPNLNFIQGNATNGGARTNVVEDVFGTIHTNSRWVGIGYSVSNWIGSNGIPNAPGVGTLYRFSESTNNPLFYPNNLLSDFTSNINNGTFSNFYRVADGVIHFKIYAFDSDGNEMPYQYAYEAQNSLTATPQLYEYPTYTNASGQGPVYLPHSLDIELGVLEPEVIAHAKALYTSGATQAGLDYISNAIGQVQIFRQHVLIPAAP